MLNEAAADFGADLRRVRVGIFERTEEDQSPLVRAGLADEYVIDLHVAAGTASGVLVGRDQREPGLDARVIVIGARENRAGEVVAIIGYVRRIEEATDTYVSDLFVRAIAQRVADLGGIFGPDAALESEVPAAAWAEHDRVLLVRRGLNVEVRRRRYLEPDRILRTRVVNVAFGAAARTWNARIVVEKRRRRSTEIVVLERAVEIDAAPVGRTDGEFVFFVLLADPNAQFLVEQKLLVVEVSDARRLAAAVDLLL